MLRLIAIGALIAYLYANGNTAGALIVAAVAVGLHFGGWRILSSAVNLGNDIGNNQLHVERGSGLTTIIYKRPSQFNRLILDSAEGNGVTEFRVQPRYVNYQNAQFNTNRQPLVGRSTQIFGSYAAPPRTAKSHLNMITVTLFHPDRPQLDLSTIDFKVATRADPTNPRSVARYRF